MLTSGSYAAVNGLHLYYEIHGSGEPDSVRTSYAVEMFELLGGGKADGGWDGSGMSRARFAVMPGTTHYTIFSSPRLASIVTTFLNTPVRKAS